MRELLHERVINRNGCLMVNGVIYRTSEHPFSRVFVSLTPEGVFLIRQDGGSELLSPEIRHGGIFA